MRSFLFSKIAIVLHLVLFFLYLFSGQTGNGNVASSLPIVVLALSLVEVAFLFPAARAAEESQDARIRVLRSFFSDPSTYIFFLLFLFLAVQILNGPRTLVWDRPSGEWIFSGGRIPWLVSSVDSLEAVGGLFLLLCAFPLFVAIKHAMGRKGRLALFRSIVLASAIFALKALFRGGVTGEEGVLFFMTAIPSLGLAFRDMALYDPAEPKNGAKPRILSSAAAFLVNASASLASLSPLVILLFAIAFVSVLVVSLRNLYLNHGANSTCLKVLAFVVFLAAVLLFLHYVAYPSNPFHSAFDSIGRGEFFQEPVRDEMRIMDRVAMRMAKDNFFGGVGFGSFANEYCFPRYVKRDEWQFLGNQESGIVPTGSDACRFLAESGFVGFALALLPFAGLLYLAAKRIVLLVRYGTKLKFGKNNVSASDGARIGFLDIFTPEVFSAALAVAGASLLSFFMPALHSGAAIAVWTAFFLLAYALMPVPVKNRE